MLYRVKQQLNNGTNAKFLHDVLPVRLNRANRNA